MAVSSPAQLLVLVAPTVEDEVEASSPCCSCSSNNDCVLLKLFCCCFVESRTFGFTEEYENCGVFLDGVCSIMEVREMPLATSILFGGDNTPIIECSRQLRDMGFIGDGKFGFRRTIKSSTLRSKLWDVQHKNGFTVNPWRKMIWVHFCCFLWGDNPREYCTAMSLLFGDNKYHLHVPTEK